MKHIVLISSGQPSTNPRLVKEADALIAAGFSVTVIYQYWSSWAAALDTELLQHKLWKAICVGGTPLLGSKTFFLSRLIHKVTKSLSAITLNWGIAELAIARSALFLKLEAKKHHADLYVAHNLGALAAAVSAAKCNGTKAAFDAEDFHRQEATDDKESLDFQLKAYLENKYFPQLDYLSTASPLISKAYQQLFPKLGIQTILNVFPKEDTTSLQHSDSTGILKLFWFSQTIGRERGLEQIIMAITDVDGVELHLLGELRSTDQRYFENFMQGVSLKPNKVHFHTPITSTSIISFASQFDVGLATEIGTPYNRDICLTNKIFTYLQAGIAILASNTQAQVALLNDYPAFGVIYDKSDISQLRESIAVLQRNPSLLAKQKQRALELGQTALNWELESEKFITLVKQTIT